MAEGLKGVLVDTSAWLEFLRDTRSPTARALERMIQEKEPMRISGLIVTELLRGCPSEEDAAALAESLLAWPAVEPVYPSTYKDAARLHRTARSRGLTIRGTVDCVVAALAIEHGLAILHLDRDYAALRKISALMIA